MQLFIQIEVSRSLNSDSHLPKNFVFVCFSKSPFKMMKNVFLFLVKSPFLSGDIYIFYLEIFTFFIWRHLHFLSGDIYIFVLIFWLCRRTAEKESYN